MVGFAIRRPRRRPRRRSGTACTRVQGRKRQTTNNRIQSTFGTTRQAVLMAQWLERWYSNQLPKDRIFQCSTSFFRDFFTFAKNLNYWDAYAVTPPVFFRFFLFFILEITQRCQMGRKIAQCCQMGRKCWKLIFCTFRCRLR